MQKFKKAVKDITSEYLSGVDRQDFVRDLTALNATSFHAEVVKIVVTTSLDGSDEDRKKGSLLLQHLFQHDIISQTQVNDGFHYVFNRISDLSLDIPKVKELLEEFVKRAVAAEYLPSKVGDKLVKGSSDTSDPEKVTASKKLIKDAVREYFASGDITEIRSLLHEDLSDSSFHHEVVKQAISLSLDGNNRQRELASYMISSFSGYGLDASEVEKGFEILLQRVEDLYNDVPNILQYLSSFVARAIADEALPPSFLVHVHVPDHDMAYGVVKHAESLLKQTLASARLAKVWGPTSSSVYKLKKLVRDLIVEFFQSGDVDEAVRCVKDLDAPYFLHEVVKRVVVLASEHGKDKVDPAITLLKALQSADVLSENQLKMGLSRVESSIDDISLDAPNAKEVFAGIKAGL